MILGALVASGVRCWIGGGWGIDALLHQQTRPHEDLDLAVPNELMPDALDTLAELGFQVVEDLDWRPVRVALRDLSNRQVDVHPLQFDGEGNGVQANLASLLSFRYPAGELTSGVIGGRVVPCISASLQLEFHRGYDLSRKDRDDIGRLRSLL